MSSAFDRAVRDIIAAIQESGRSKTSPFDRTAKVVRVDEEAGIAWVHFPGGVDETPVSLTIAATAGDTVQVRSGGGKAWLTGNASAPPTDDTTAILARRLANLAGNAARKAQQAAEGAQLTADNAWKKTVENTEEMAQIVIEFNADIEGLQDQIDGNITTWFYTVDPAMNLPPTTDWDTDAKKDAHLGDIYYNTVKGYAWRFMKSGSTYSWERISDTDVTKALADAAKAQDTADQKRRVFYSQPTPPYDAGDLWVQGSGGDILRCSQAKTPSGSYDRNDWVLASKYTDDSALNTWIAGDFADTIEELEEGVVDAKVDTYYQTSDPSTAWTTTELKNQHKGDLWYNSTSTVQKYYRWSGTAWQELTATPPQAVFDSIDGKATIFTGSTTPSNPSTGDLWFKSANDPILTYVGGSWIEYNKYTDDSALTTWLSNTYATDKTNLQNQIDGKAETWYQAADPSTNWTAAEKSKHAGDLWYDTDDGTTWFYTGSAWSQQNIPTSVFNTINGKANIFVGSTTPVSPKTGDLWLESATSDILTYVNNSWVKYNKYTDDSTANAIAEDLQENYSTTEEISEEIVGAIDGIQNYTFYKYASDGSGTDFSDDTTLQYRGVFTSIVDEPSENPRDYKWEINPVWAAQVAESYIEDEVQNTGFRIVSPDPATYARFTALFMAFFMNDVLQMRMGYDSVNETYGVMAPEIHALGSGAGVKFDGSTEASVRGRFVWEIRDNGHLSLKRF